MYVHVNSTRKSRQRFFGMIQVCGAMRAQAGCALAATGFLAWRNEVIPCVVPDKIITACVIRVVQLCPVAVVKLFISCHCGACAAMRVPKK